MSDDPLAGIKAPPGYEILSVLGRGGMGVVVKARESASKKIVALKYLHRVDPDVRERFMREARLSTELHHPNIIAGLGVEFVDDSPVVVFDYMESTDLSAVIRRDRRLPQDRAVAIMRQVLAGLDHAHRAGVVHRDLKSANVLVSATGVAKLADFGVAHLRDAQERLTRTGAVLGTPAYMAPEQAEGTKIDERTDIYAAGVILFEMLTGTYPISGISPIDMMSRVLVDIPMRITEIVPELDLRLSDIVARCLEKKPGDRFPSAEALLIALDPRAALAERSQSTLPDAPEGWDPAAGATQDASSAAGRPRRTTGRVRVLAGVNSTAAPSGPLPVRSGVVHPTSKISISETIVPNQPAARSSWLWVAVGALCVIAIGAFAWRRHTASGVVGDRTPVALVVHNSADSGFLAFEGGRTVLAFETDPPEELAAVATSGRGEMALERFEPLCKGNRQVFDAPPELLLEPFSVRFTRADGRPLTNGALSHPGLFHVVEAWRQKLRLDAAGEVTGAPRGPRWAQLLDALDRALGGASDGFIKIANVKDRMDDAAAAPLARSLALRARKALGPLLATAPALLDLPDAVLPLTRRQIVYDTLAAPRVLDRLLSAGGQSDALLGADKALGKQFRAGPATGTPPAEAGTKRVRGRLIAFGAPPTSGEDLALFQSAAQAASRDHPAPQQAIPVAVLLQPRTGATARVELHCHMWEGETEPLPKDALIWIALPDRGWRLLITGANEESSATKRKEDGVYVHYLDPALLSSKIAFKLTREILPFAAKHDRRVFPQHIERITVQRD